MTAGVVPFVCYYGGKLSDEDRDAKYFGGTRKGGAVPKSISFANFKEKIEQFISLPSNGMDIKIKCGVNLDGINVICVDVDDDDSLRFVMDQSTYIRAYILQNDHYQVYGSSNRRCNDNHDSEPIPVEDVNTEHPEVHSDDISGVQVNHLIDNGAELDPSSLHGLSQTNFHSQDGGINMPTGNQDDHEILEGGSWEDPSINISSQPNFDAGDGRTEIQMGNQNDLEILQNQNWVDPDLNMFPQPHAGHLDEGMDSPMCDHEDFSVLHVINEEELNEEYQATSQLSKHIMFDMSNQTSACEPARLASTDFGIALGLEFLNIYALRNALSEMAIRTDRAYDHVRTSPYELIMKCRSEGCDWRIHATGSSVSSKFKVVKYLEVHTCMPYSSNGDKDHPQATVRWIMSKSGEMNADIEPRKIVKLIKDSFGIQISYNKAVKAKTKAVELIHNRVKDSNPLPHPDLFRTLKKELEHGGTICKLGLNPDGSRFEYLFWSFRACVDALHNHLRPVVYVDMVPTRIGVLMYARGADGNAGRWSRGQPIDVGFALYVTVDETSWDTFLGWLTEFVLPPSVAAVAEDNSKTPPFAIVTDFKKPVVRAVQKLHGIHHFFHTDNLRTLFESKGRSLGLSTWDFSLLSPQLYGLEECEEYLEDIKSWNEEAYEWLLSVGPKSHWVIAFSPNKHAAAAAEQLKWDHETINKRFEYLHSSAPLEKLDRDKILEKLSVVEIVESSREAVAKYFSYRRIKADEATTTGLTPIHERDIEHVGSLGCVVNGNGPKYQVTWNYSAKTWVVDLVERSCTCSEFQATGYLCREATAVILHLKVDIRDYIDRWYTLDTYRATYAGSLPPPIRYDISQWKTAVDDVPLPPRKRVRKGRPRKSKQNEVQTEP